MKLSFCLILIQGLAWAQTTTAPAPTSTPPINSAPVTSVLNTIQTSNGKYDEYQSICRTNEYDRVSQLDVEIQKKRVALINEKIKNTLTSSKLKLRLLKEYVDQVKYKEAEDFFIKLKSEKLSEEDSQTADAIYAITKNDLKKAEKILAKTVLDHPKNKETLKYLAEIYLLDKNYFEASAAYFDLAKLTKDDYSFEQCEIHTLDAQPAEADKFCKKAIQANASTPYPLINLGILQREKLNYDEALRYFKDSLEIKKTEMAYTCIAEIYFIKEKFTLAASFFENALQTNSKSARAQLGLAWAHFKAKDFNASLQNFKSSCEKDRRIKAEIRKAYKILSEQKSTFSKSFADMAQSCSD